MIPLGLETALTASLLACCFGNTMTMISCMLADANLTGTLPASLGTALPDLQLLSLRNNPGNCFGGKTALSSQDDPDVIEAALPNQSAEQQHLALRSSTTES